VEQAHEGSGNLATGLDQLSSKHQKLVDSSFLLQQQIEPLLIQLKTLLPSEQENIDLLIKGIKDFNDGIVQEKQFLDQFSNAASNLTAV